MGPHVQYGTNIEFFTCELRYYQSLCWGASPPPQISQDSEGKLYQAKTDQRYLRVNKLTHVSLFIMFCSFFLYTLQCSLDVSCFLLMFLFDIPSSCSSKSHKIYILYTHTETINNSIGDNNGTKHVFLRANKIDKLGASCLTTVWGVGAWL